MNGFTKLVTVLLVPSFLCKSIDIVAETCYASPTPKIPCTHKEDNCLTLSDCIKRAATHFISNITLILLPGNHSLERDVTIENLTNLTIVGHKDSTHVVCNQQTNNNQQNRPRINITAVNYVHINSLTFIGCRRLKVSRADNFSMEDSRFIGNNGEGIELKHIYRAKIVSSTFHSNNATTQDSDQDSTSLGSGMAVIESNISIIRCTFTNYSTQVCGGGIYAWKSTSLIVNTTFITNKANIGGGICSKNGTLILIESLFNNNSAHEYGGAVYTGNSTVKVVTTRFAQSKADIGGAVASEDSEITVENSEFINTNTSNTGVITVDNSPTKIIKCHFSENRAGILGTVVIANSTITIQSSTFENNYGGVLFPIDISVVNIEDSVFTNNTGENAKSSVIIIDSVETTILIKNCTFDSNTFTGDKGNAGGAVSVGSDRNTIAKTMLEKSLHITEGPNIKLYDCTFSNNEATFGGAIAVYSGKVTVSNCVFHNNTAESGGGAIYASGGIVNISSSNFTFNTADNGGAIYVTKLNTYPAFAPIIRIEDTTFSYNTAYFSGGAIVSSTAILNMDSNKIVYNTAQRGYHTVVITMNSTFVNTGSLELEWNTGSFFVFNSTASISGITKVANNNHASFFVELSTVSIQGSTIFTNNSAIFSKRIQNMMGAIGSAITCVRSQVFLKGTHILTQNIAFGGGGISTIESTVYFDGDITIVDNTALISGGGIFSHYSEVIFSGKAKIKTNSAQNKGGGVYSVASNLKLLNGHLLVEGNTAKYGGGINLERNSKLYVVKSNLECIGHSINSKCIYDEDKWLQVRFLENFADYGGGLYIEDGDPDVCGDGSLLPAQCSIQVLQFTFLNDIQEYEMLNLLNFYFINNTARVAGSAIYGGLFDRCQTNLFSEPHYITLNSNNSSLPSKSNTSLTIETNIETNQIKSLIASEAVFVCFCKEGVQDCGYQPDTFYVQKGQSFKFQAVAVDHVDNPINLATIHSAPSSNNAGLSTGQQSQTTTENCSDLRYNLFSANDSEQILLYAEGPCKDRGISLRFLNVQFLPCTCPIGFKPSDSKETCECKCDPEITLYVLNCYSDTGYVQRKGDSWVSYENNTIESGFVLYPHCPFDYCYPPGDIILINLSTPDGADEQCAHNRSKRLCGSCKDGLSLSFGSSRCMQCSNYWLVILLPIALAGALLVLVLLLCNLTVATGTINGLIFYANILAANQSVFLNFEKPNILTVFVAWLNLDIGLEFCFYNGMDAYAKIWLQLVFPLYIFALVVAIIKGCKYSQRLSRLLLGKNPVATLATLILLSYTKLLRTIIAVLSHANLKMPDGSYQMVWLFDANVQYLKGKHVALFLISVLILLFGSLYTFLLFFWQWAVYLSSKPLLKWLTNTKLNAFMDAYHAPYNPKHRYWSGLLLIARAQLYLVSALNVLGDHRVDLLAIICTTAGLIVIKTLGAKRYKKLSLEILETMFLLNLLILSTATLYNWETSGNQIAVACISVSIALVTFGGIVVYHVYSYTTKMCVTLNVCLKTIKNCYRKHNSSYCDTDSVLSTTDHERNDFEHEQIESFELIVTDHEVHFFKSKECTQVENQTGFHNTNT